MKKNTLFCFIAVLIVFASSYAAVPTVHFKMEAPKTDLLPGESVTVTVSAWAADPLATGLNGLNYWAFSALVDKTDVVNVSDASITLLGPTPVSSFALTKNSANQAVTGGTGSIDYLNAYPSGLPIATSTGLGYDPIVSFVITAIGSVGDSVTYTLGDTNGFLGILADGVTDLDGTFDADLSQNVFTIVPEPATLLLLGLGLAALGRKVR